MEVYIDDVLVKLESQGDLLTRLKEAFQLMRHHRLCLNPNKCAFRVESGKFLGYLINKSGIEVLIEQANSVVLIRPLKARK